MDFLTEYGLDNNKAFYGFIVVIFIIIAIAAALHYHRPAYYPMVGYNSYYY